MKTLLLSIFLIILCGTASSQIDSVYNINAAQRTDGTMLVDIHYDLYGVSPDYEIIPYVSFDGGSTYDTLNNTTGDAGPGIIPGAGKYILWDFGTQFPGQFSSNVLIKILAYPNWECGYPIIDPRDNRHYNTVIIGTQCWMAENLDIGTMIPGSSGQSNDSILEKYCYDNNPANCGVYGGLYQWDEMMQYVNTYGTQGICPDGWHLPTDGEWCVLEQFVDPTITCESTGWRGLDGGGKLKEVGTSHWLSPNTGATNSSGFTALPGGFRLTDGSFANLGYHGDFWSSSENGTHSWGRFLHNYTAQVYRENSIKTAGQSARCLYGDYINQPPEPPANPAPADSAVNQAVITTLSWSCSEPENEPLTYDVYFGTDNPPALVASGQTVNAFDPGTLGHYTQYFWKIVAHDASGNITEGAVWSFTTVFTFYCGEILPATHTAGEVAPVSKTVNYLTTASDLTGGNKCWISQNLGSGQQATSSSDTTEISAGWYWQFNRKQGFMHDGVTLTPEWVNTAINESSDWLSTNDPCSGLLGADWRLPTNTEWNNAYENGGWGNLNEPYESALKLHSAGYLGYADGSLSGRGSVAMYWSSTQSSSTKAWGMNFLSDNSDLSGYNKAFGFSIRCLSDTVPVNTPPQSPSNPVPSDGSTNQPINTTLSWTCSDPEYDPLSYDIYFGTANPPALVSSGQSANTYNPGTLLYSTTYFWKIVAHDDYSNTTEGAVWSFTTISETWSCGQPITDSRDAQLYNTVQIGTQCWMQENLNIGTMLVGTSEQTNNSVIEKYCYDNNIANCDVYGGLYQWNEMMQYLTTPGTQGICPIGWHLPTDAEWCALEQFVDSTITCSSTGWRGVDGGGKLKETGTTYWMPPNTGATNATGFTGLPGGYHDTNGLFYNQGAHAYFWTSTEEASAAWCRLLDYFNSKVGRSNSYSDGAGMSIRCAKDITPPTWSCGQPLPVNHTAGDIAPVNKSVNYGTVETNLTGTNQCWITQNLGSDRQALSATDASEESAGWYWQFNRKQGYKHDGTTRTPNTWETMINENSDWLPVNDPCALLLGTGWRLPTSTEWTNADANGGWNNYNDVYASELKLHSSGWLFGAGGDLEDRGNSAFYRSSTQNSSDMAWSLHFYSSFCSMHINIKTDGFSIRCLNDLNPISWSCGQPLPINHIAGDIAPVNKTVSYGTVETNLTGTNQCWITQNLGSDRQALSATDATEESAGWYWQFNRKQGYKHDGTTRTPNTWETLINENSDWLPANDPCALILGTGWRLPTNTEWTNAIANGGWGGYNATYASLLKLHTAGCLNPDGSRANIGYDGNYWSSTQYNNPNSLHLFFQSNTTAIYNALKTHGISIRCLVDGILQNQPPSSPANPEPTDGAANQPVNTTISWSCSDPENDPLTYDVYFGTANPPAIVSTGQAAITYNPGTLLYSTTYFWKIVAHDDHSNTTEGAVWSFTTVSLAWSCGDPLIDSRDTQSYSTVQIGTQCWMAQNLNIGTFVNSSSNQLNNSIIEKYCHSNNTANCTVYGGLYQWNEMMQYLTTPGTQGICPAGWHLPTDAEWCTLEQYVDATISCSATGYRGVDGGGKLKEAGTTRWLPPNTGATNSSGFTALPGGYRYTDGSFGYLGYTGHFWSSSENGSDAWYRYLYYDNAQVLRDFDSKADGFSVRCIRIDFPSNQPPTSPTSPTPPDGATNQPVNTSLSWSCSDPENDPLTYDVYFGTANPPSLVSTGQSASSYDPGTLNSDTQYFWKIVVHDDHSNTTEGTVWSFSTEESDVDGDGVPDTMDNCPADWNPGQEDCDGINGGDACDPAGADNDGDGICNPYDNCPDTPNPGQEDCDGVGGGDACDPLGADNDLDGICNPWDNCPDDSNPLQEDCDGNGMGDACDPAGGDDDGDGLCNSWDNCPWDWNPDQADCNNNGLGDVCDPEPCDPDMDGDGVPDSIDNCPGDWNPGQEDCDGDGVGDACDWDCWCCW